jgi:hypothetical protein
MMNQEQAKDLVRKINTCVQGILAHRHMATFCSSANCHNRGCRFMRDFKQRPNDPEQDSRHVQVNVAGYCSGTAQLHGAGA